MALKREMEYALKNGEKATGSDYATYAWVGGSPVQLNTSGAITGNVGETGFFGTAYHNNSFDRVLGLCTYLRKPHIVTLEEGTDQEIDGTDHSDAYAPWKEAITDFAVADLLRPTTQGSSPAYSCWTNEAYSNEIANSMYIYPARIIAMTGSGSSVTEIQIEVDDFYRIA